MASAAVAVVETTKKRTTFDLCREVESVFADLDAANEAGDGDESERLMAELDKLLDQDIPEKLIALDWAAKLREQNAERYKAEADRFAAHAKKAKDGVAFIEGLSVRLAQAWVLANGGGKEVPLPDGRKAKLASRKSDAVDVVVESTIPDKFMVEKTSRSPDKAAIKAALKAGEDVPGCVLEQRENFSVKLTG